MTESKIMALIPEATSLRKVNRIIECVKGFPYSTSTGIFSALENQVKSGSFPNRKQETATNSIRAARMKLVR
ncbi:MAG: hypothetical protein WCY41_00425 [Candidatus Micrarchaeia archaeon]